MKEVKVSELHGLSLDYAVAEAIGWKEPFYGIGDISYFSEERHQVKSQYLKMAAPDPDEPDEVTEQHHFNHLETWAPSRFWSQGGPLIERFSLHVWPHANGWSASGKKEGACGLQEFCLKRHSLPYAAPSLPPNLATWCKFLTSWRGEMEPEILHVPELAKMLNRTECAIRSAIRDGAGWLPPGFKQGVRHCWRTESVRSFLREYESGSHKAPKVGRKRQEPPRLKGVA